VKRESGLCLIKQEQFNPAESSDHCGNKKEGAKRSTRGNTNFAEKMSTKKAGPCKKKKRKNGKGRFGGAGTMKGRQKGRRF